MSTPSSFFSPFAPAPLAMPVMQEQLTDYNMTVTQPWWRFFFGLYKRVAASVPATVATGLTATGTTQGTAAQLGAQWNEITDVAAGTGVLLFNLGTGINYIVWNQGANDLNVYPPVGAAIDGLGVNAPLVVAVGKCQALYQITSTQLRTLQL